MINSKVLANAVGGKTARACDGCVKRRARWYCPSDDAFLCQTCDSSVHSANMLSSRHERVRLKSSSSAGKRLSSSPPSATWHHGFTRKARTPRSSGPAKKNYRQLVHDLVPELSVDEQLENHEEEQLIYRVPVVEPFVVGQCKNDDVEIKDEFLFSVCTNNVNPSSDGYNDHNNNVESCLNEFFPTEKELAEFAADVETLLGRGLENEPLAMEELGLAEGCVNNKRSSSAILKIENGDEEECVVSDDAHTEPAFELSFDYDSHATCGEEDNQDENKLNVVKAEENIKEKSDGWEMKNEKKNNLMLRLDYERVIATWGGQGPPWTPGGRPEFDPVDEWSSIYVGSSGTEGNEHQYGVGFMGGGIGLHQAFADGGREARVTRYREKRRTRLFSKKIRYEVRKLNAEKRPRMKGRFVKRASFAASAAFSSA